VTFDGKETKDWKEKRKKSWNMVGRKTFCLKLTPRTLLLLVDSSPLEWLAHLRFVP
jgi:hypothetical protein